MELDYTKIDWSRDRERFLDSLYALGDNSYKTFSEKITIGSFKTIGIKFPELKIIAKEIRNGDYLKFLKMDSANILEVQLIKGFVIAGIPNLEEYKKRFFEFLPTIDNWEVCDSFVAASKIIPRNREVFFDISKDLISRRGEFENRVGFVMLLNYFVSAEYIDEIFSLIKNFESEYYYAKMALAWLLSCLYIEYPSNTQKFLLEANYDREIKKLTVRKIKDSYRVSKENKEWLENIRL